jgi:hypothetical protein
MLRLEAELSLDPCSLDHPGEAGRCEWLHARSADRIAPRVIYFYFPILFF